MIFFIFLFDGVNKLIFVLGKIGLISLEVHFFDGVNKWSFCIR